MDQPDREQSHRYSFERLVEEYADRIFNVALRITGDRRDAEDATQEAFLNAFRAWSSFRGESSPTTWLYRIAVNTALMRVRSRPPLTYNSTLSNEEDDRDWSASLVDVDRRVDLQQQLLDGLGALEPELRSALVLRDVDGLSTAEAAHALDITEAALKSRLHRARLLLRQHLADYFRER
jgi:RNA polymerase sigma-70 factor (ECF subfamily)